MSAAEVLGKHQWLGGIVGCGCGWKWPEERTYFCGEDERIAKAHIAHQLDALKAAGYAVVELPEAGRDDSGLRFVSAGINPADNGPGAKYAKVVIEPTPWGTVLQGIAIPSRPSPTDARVIAAALLAAANVAEAAS